MTALLLLGAGHADAVPGAGVRVDRGRSSTSPTTTPSWPRAVARGPRASSWRSSRRWRRRRRSARARRSGARARRSRAASSTRRSASGTRRDAGAAPRSAARCAASDPAFAQQRGAIACTARCWATQALALRFFAATARRRRPAAARQPGPRPARSRRCPSRCSRRRPGSAGARCGRARHPRYGGARHAPALDDRRRAGACPAHARCRARAARRDGMTDGADTAAERRRPRGSAGARGDDRRRRSSRASGW